MTMTANLSIHRRLDELFADIPRTAAARDLKEELRGSLVARVEELEGRGMGPEDAAERAITELGDIEGLLEDDAIRVDTDPWLAHRIRLRPGFVVRATILPILAAAGLGLAFLAGAGVIPGGALAAAALAAAFAVLLGLVCADSLRQETMANHPMPRARAIGYGAGLTSLLAGVAGIALCWVTPWPVWAWLVGGGVLTVAGIGVLAGLGATQTNRQRAWAREWTQRMATGGQQPAGTGGPYAPGAAGRPTRFERDPDAAARFGIYTAVLWILAITAGVLLGIFVGWWWSALPAVGAIATMLLLLTRMLFTPERT